MRKSAPAIGVAIAAISLVIGLAGCSSGKNDAKSLSSSSSSSSAASSSPTTSTSAQAAGSNPTIDDYLKKNNIQPAPIVHSTPGAPTIVLPEDIPGWTVLPESQDAPYGGIKLDAPASSNDPPTVIAIFQKLPTDTSIDELVAVTPGEVKNFPGFSGGDGEKDSLANFPAYHIGGTYQKDGATRVVAQKTVFIQAPDGLYLLRLDAEGPEADQNALMDALKAIDDRTTITV